MNCLASNKQTAFVYNPGYILNESTVSNKAQSWKLDRGSKGINKGRYMDTNTETLSSSRPSLLWWNIQQQPGTSSRLLCTAQKKGLVHVCRRSLQESSLKLQSSGRIKLNLLVFAYTGQSEEEGIALPLNPARRETLHLFYLNFVFF